VYADTPFGDHVVPCVQEDGAFCGQVPARSLEATRVRSNKNYVDYDTAYPPVIKCTLPCGPLR
jgi:hypothetical protein